MNGDSFIIGKTRGASNRRYDVARALLECVDQVVIYFESTVPSLQDQYNTVLVQTFGLGAVGGCAGGGIQDSFNAH